MRQYLKVSECLRTEGRCWRVNPAFFTTYHTNVKFSFQPLLLLLVVQGNMSRILMAEDWTHPQLPCQGRGLRAPWDHPVWCDISNSISIIISLLCEWPTTNRYKSLVYLITWITRASWQYGSWYCCQACLEISKSVELGNQLVLPRNK